MIRGIAFVILIKTHDSVTPKMKTRAILTHRFSTPLGRMLVCTSDNSVCLLEFDERKNLDIECQDLQKRLKAAFVTGKNHLTKQTQQQILEYFAGTRTHFNLPLMTLGTAFQNDAWQSLQKIPYGQTRSYQEQASAIERPTAVRAVASANSHNRIAIVIPCHRVIGKNGSLTGYAGGLERKRWLLAHEKDNVQKKRATHNL